MQVLKLTRNQSKHKIGVDWTCTPIFGFLHFWCNISDNSKPFFQLRRSKISKFSSKFGVLHLEQGCSSSHRNTHMLWDTTPKLLQHFTYVECLTAFTRIFVNDIGHKLFRHLIFNWERISYSTAVLTQYS